MTPTNLSVLNVLLAISDLLATLDTLQIENLTVAQSSSPFTDLCQGCGGEFALLDLDDDWGLCPVCYTNYDMNALVILLEDDEPEWFEISLDELAAEEIL